MKLIRSLVPLCALLLPCALTAETFEGKVTMSMSSGSKDGSQSMNYSIKEGVMRLDVMTDKGGGGMIFDFKNKQMIILMAQQKMYMVRPIPDASAAQQPAAAGAPPVAKAAAGDRSFRDTGEKETILGYVCEKYEVTSAKGTADIWATDKLGMFGGFTMGGGPGGRRSQAPQEWESVIKGSGFFPMRVVSTENGKTSKLEVTNVEKMSLPDSVFTPPSDWRKFDLGAMMGGAMPGGYPGARPADGNN